MRISLAIAIGASCLLSACAADDDGAPTSDGSEGVTLRAQSPEHIAGSYGRLRFDSTRYDDVLTLDLRTPDHVLVSIETVGDTYRFSYMDGRARFTIDRAWVANPTDDVVWEGDPAVLDEMLALPEVADLPWLSRTLGAMGFTGSDYPASLALHKMGRQSADALGIEVPPILTPESGGNDRCSRPYYNECYGMCGPGCSCWSWVCGDCCYHGGCAQHDSWCRQGQWYWCYNITAVIALFGC